MKRPPRRGGSQILGGASTARLVLIGLTIFSVSITGYVLGFRLGYDEAHARSLGFTAMIMAQIAIIPAELGTKRLRVSELLQNRRFLWVVSVALASYLAVLYFPPAASAAKLSFLSPADWAYVLASAFVAYLVAEVSKRFRS